MKSNSRKLSLILLTVAALGGISTAQADSCTASLNWTPDVTQADRAIMKNACASGWLPHWWAVYGFAARANYWNDGFGSDQICNADLPLGRMMNALYLLKFSYLPANNWGNFKGMYIQWGYPYAAKQFVEANAMEAHCGEYKKDGMPKQYASTAIKGLEDHFEWKMGFFYLENPVERAMTLFHESTHRGTRKNHHNNCEDKGEKDRSWAYHGAYYYGVNWLRSYCLHANTNTNSTYKKWAAQAANTRIADKFCAGDVPASVKNWAGSMAGSSCDEISWIAAIMQLMQMP
jgi:hypothetical protein